MDVLEKQYQYIDRIIADMTELLPDDVNKLQAEYLVSNMRKSATLLADSMQEEEDFQQLDFDTQCFYIQIMAEWSFHKEIDLFRSGIPAKYWKIVMQKIWYVMWEVMYACVKNDAPNEVVLTLVERFVNRAYVDAIEELKYCNIIDEEVEEKAKGQSNIAIMASQLRALRFINDKIKQFAISVVLLLIIAVVVSFAIIRFKTVGLIAILTILICYLFIPKSS